VECGKRQASRAEKCRPVIVDIFGNCLPRVQASEEYLSKSAPNSLFSLFLLYESISKQVFKSNNT